MRSPDQLAAQLAAGTTATAAAVRRALYLSALAGDGADAERAMRALRCSRRTLQRLCRRDLIDLADYRPYARLEQRGEPRPEPQKLVRARR